jgi:MSHA biogenesis protein MshQ
VPLWAQYWNGTAFVMHASDACTQLVTADLRMTPVPPGLPTAPTIANNPLLLGDAGLSLSPPGAGNTGYVDLEFDLSIATGAALPWLRYDWDGDTIHDDNPTGRATFGIYAGSAPIIYQRELY